MDSRQTDSVPPPNPLSIKGEWGAHSSSESHSSEPLLVARRRMWTVRGDALDGAKHLEGVRQETPDDAAEGPRSQCLRDTLQRLGTFLHYDPQMVP